MWLKAFRPIMITSPLLDVVVVLFIRGGGENQAEVKRGHR